MRGFETAVFDSIFGFIPVSLSRQVLVAAQGWANLKVRRESLVVKLHDFARPNKIKSKWGEFFVIINRCCYFRTLEVLRDNV